METGDRWATRSATSAGTPWATSPCSRLADSEAVSPTIMSVKKMPMDRTWAEFWNVVFMPEPAPRCSAGRLFMTPARLGEPNEAMNMPGGEEQRGEHPVGEVDRQELEQDEADGGAEHAAGGERPGAEPVRQDPRQRAGDEEPEGEREHGDAGPQRGHREGVAVEGQPDPLEPDDQHEHQAAPAEGGQEAGQDAGGEGPDLEQLEPEHRLGHAGLDHAERDQEDDAEGQGPEHQRVGPPHHVAAVGLDAVGDPDHDQDQPDGEGDVAGPVDPGRPAGARLVELEVAQ